MFELIFFVINSIRNPELKCIAALNNFVSRAIVALFIFIILTSFTRLYVHIYVCVYAGAIFLPLI